MTTLKVELIDDGDVFERTIDVTSRKGEEYPVIILDLFKDVLLMVKENQVCYACGDDGKRCEACA